MKLTILSPTETTVTSIAWLEINTPTGNYIIQQGHAPMILTLSPNKAFIYRMKTGKQETIMIRHGIIEVDREEVTIVFMKSDSE